MLGGTRARCAIEKAPQCESLGGARARCRPGRTRKLAILAPTDAHDERRRVRHGGRTGVDLELHDPAYWPTGLLAYIDVLAYWPTGWWSGLCAVCAEREGGCVCAHLNACVGQREGRGGGGEETDGASGVAARLQRASNSPLDASSLSRLEAADGWRTAGWWQRAPGLARGRSKQTSLHIALQANVLQPLSTVWHSLGQLKIASERDPRRVQVDRQSPQSRRLTFVSM